MTTPSTCRSARNSTHFGITNRSKLLITRQTPSRVVISNQSSFESNNWTWDGQVLGSLAVQSVSWGVSCLKTTCRENQDGWAVEMWGKCTHQQEDPNELLKLRQRSHTNSSIEINQTKEETPLTGHQPPRPSPSPRVSLSFSHELSSNYLEQLLLANSPIYMRQNFSSPSPITDENNSPISRQRDIPQNNSPISFNTSPNGTVESLSNDLAASRRSFSLENTPREAKINSVTFVVLDGHGAGGRDASAAVEKCFEKVYGNGVNKNDTDCGGPIVAMNLVEKSLRGAQTAIERLNKEQQRDFGTTCVSVTLVDDFLISTACGDSSAILFGFPPLDDRLTKQKSKSRGTPSDLSHHESISPIIIELARRHHLEDREEIERIGSEGKGRVIRGDGGILRLIPSSMDYEEAKRRGLSINMSRSLGHHLFSQFGLSHSVDFSLLSLWDLPKLMYYKDRPRAEALGLPPPRMMKMPSLSITECKALLSTAWKQQEIMRQQSFLKKREAIEQSLQCHDLEAFSKTRDESNGDDKENIRPNSAVKTVSTDEAGDMDMENSKFGSPASDTALNLGNAKSSSSAGRVSILRRLTKSSRVRSNGDGDVAVALLVDDPMEATSEQVMTETGVSDEARSSPSRPLRRLVGVSRKKTKEEIEKPNLITKPTKTSAVLPTISPSMEPLSHLFLLLMSDGITDVVPSLTLGSMIRDSHARARASNKDFDPTGFAIGLCEFARDRRSKAGQRPDNCTCLAVHLKIGVSMD